MRNEDRVKAAGMPEEHRTVDRSAPYHIDDRGDRLRRTDGVDDDPFESGQLIDGAVAPEVQRSSTCVATTEVIPNRMSSLLEDLAAEN